jgi:chromosome segregation protein
MRLKKLIVHGFKSFADRTEFVFDSPITGIVGPNGCGKSNVVDAFKWVLGEQSAKSLRGDAMMDVIFNGSGARKPSGLAEVVLVFENPPRAGGGRALAMDVDEVAVGRRLYRDGTSEYTVNENSSRLKDIRELFLDTGVGADAYSVIEQGKVSAMLEANPAERRIIFEEAAGISKYKVKKKEALRKLEKVDQNLLRVNDVVAEVEKQLRSVKLQAGKARVYREHTARLAELRLGYVLHEYHTHHTQSVELNRELEETQFKLDDLTGDLTTRQNELNSKREQLEGLTQHKQRNEYELVQANAAVQSAQQKQHYADQQLQQIAEQIESFERDKKSLEEKLAAVTESLSVESENLKTLTADLQQHRQQIEQRQASFRDGQLQLNQLNKESEQNKAAVLDLMRKLATVNSRIGAIEIERKNIAAQQTRLGDRRRIVVEELEALAAKKAELQLKLDAAITNIQDQQANLDAKKREAAALGKQIAQVGEHLGAAKEHRSGLFSRQKLLKDLEARRDGVSEGVKSVLKQREVKFPFIRGLVADLLEVDVEHAHVIEAALDGRDQWLVTNDQSLAIAADEALNDLEGRVNVICVDRVVQPQRDTGVRPVPATSVVERSRSSKSGANKQGQDAVVADVYDWNQHKPRIRLAVDLVRVDPIDQPIANHLLGKTIVVDDLVTAAELHHKGGRGYRFVTHQGDVLEADGILRAGPLTAAMGLLSRRSELGAVTLQIAEVDERIVALTRQLTDGNANAREMEEQQNTLRNAVYAANTVKVEVTSSIAQTNDKLNSLNREQPLLDRELDTLLGQFDRLKAEEERLTAQNAEYETDQTNRQKLVEELMAKHAKLADELKETSETLTTARVQSGQVQEKQLACQQHVQRQTVARAELVQQIARITQSAESVGNRRGNIEHELATAKHAETTLAEKRKELSWHIETLTAQVKEAGEAARSFNGQVEKLRGAHGEVESDLHTLQLEAGEVKVRLETLISRTMEEFQLDLPAKYTSLDGGYQPVDQDWTAIAGEIKELRDKINRLGSVNVDAITELEELTTRQTFLATQLADLASSKKQLEELIETINVESSARFEQTFNTVREHFQGMFRKLFGGGKADVYLETELQEKAPATNADGSPSESAGTLLTRKIDILDAGIEIIARPPGKQPATISQLSGGEKTMTCIALLMSIFKSKPSPFCILDEVDAALDEANNQRFNLIIQEFLDQSQFIVITHSKRTMQIADVLYGVTMQEQGVSKRVSVKFEQVDNKGRIAESAAA